MLKLAIGIGLASALLLAACGGAGRTSTATTEGRPAAPVPTVAPAAAPKGPAGAAAPARAGVSEGAAPGAPAVALDVAQRQVISTGALTIEVEAVSPALAQVRAIAEGLGGFVEQLASAGDPERQQASITIRVPQAQFFAALERLEALGKVQGRNVGSQDVTEQFIDLEARLQSALRQERSLLSLLERTQSVSEILTIERELMRVRSEVERLQGQLNFLKRRVELATITVALVPRQRETGEPPSASLAVDVADAAGALESIEAVTAGLGGVVDRASLSVQGGKKTARVTLRVFRAQFDQALRAIEGEGKVTAKELQEGRAPKGDGEVARPQEPDARIEVSLAEKRPWWPVVAAIVVALVVAGAIALAGYVAGRHWAGRSIPASRP